MKRKFAWLPIEGKRQLIWFQWYWTDGTEISLTNPAHATRWQFILDNRVSIWQGHATFTVATQDIVLTQHDYPTINEAIDALIDT